MKTAASIGTVARFAAVAFALALTIASPSVQPALAAGDNGGPPPASTTPEPKPPLRMGTPDLQVTSSWKIDGPLIPGENGGFALQFSIKNIGTADSKPVLVHTYCGYLMADGKIKEVAAKPMYAQPTIPKNGTLVDTIFCDPWQNRSASVLRVLAVSQGDANTSNNEFKKNVLG